MRRAAVLLALMLAACDLPGGSFAPAFGTFGLGRLSPTPDSTHTLRFQILGQDGNPAAADVAVWLNDSASDLGLGLAAAGGPLDDSLVVTTDAQGFGSVAVRFGRLAGRAVVHVSANTVGLRDSISFSLGGIVDSLDVAPVTPVHQGDTVRVNWRAFDQSGNRVFANPGIVLTASAVATVLNDSLVLADTTGATYVRYTVGPVADSAYLAVVPSGSLGALASNGVWTISELRRLAQTTTFLVPAVFENPRYSPSGDTLAYGDALHVRLRLPGGTTVQVVPAALGFAFDRHPAWSADGQWLYFTAGYGDGRTEIWRIHPDGTAAARMGPVAAAGERDSLPAIHPGDSLLAFTTNRALDGGQPTLRIMNLNNGSTVFAGPWGFHARFSPDGSRLAFVTRSQLAIAAADGSNLQIILSPSHIYFGGQVSWSPDSRWVAAAHGGTALHPLQLHLVDVNAATAIRLPWSAGWTRPDWR